MVKKKRKLKTSFRSYRAGIFVLCAITSAAASEARGHTTCLDYNSLSLSAEKQGKRGSICWPSLFQSLVDSIIPSLLPIHPPIHPVLKTLHTTNTRPVLELLYTAVCTDRAPTSAAATTNTTIPECHVTSDDFRRSFPFIIFLFLLNKRMLCVFSKMWFSLSLSRTVPNRPRESSS